MDLPNNILCERCGATARVLRKILMQSDKRVTEAGETIEKDEGTYYIIDCPMCGQHEQALTTDPRDLDRNQ